MRWYQKAARTIARGLGLTDSRLARFFGGASSHAGEHVTVHTSMNLSAVWACVRLIADNVATLPLALYQDQDDGGRVVQKGHPLHRVLKVKPNADMSAVRFWQTMVASLLLWGNAYALILVTAGKVRGLTPMRPDRMTVRRLDNGRLQYTYRDDKGHRREYDEALVFHLRGFSLDGIMGMSPIAQARHSLGLALAADKAAGKLFANGIRGWGHYTSPTYLDDKERERADSMLDRFRGAEKTGRTPFLEGGWKWEDMTIPPVDAELLASRKFGIEEICRWYNVPPFLVGHTEKSTTWGTGLEQIVLGFLTFTMRGILRSIEAEIAVQLLTPVEQLELYAEFNLDGFLRADSAGRALLMSTYAQNGLRNRNEIRRMDNLAAVPGGDKITVQSNLVDLATLGQAGSAAPASEQARQAIGTWLFGGPPAEVIAAAIKAAHIGTAPPREE